MFEQELLILGLLKGGPKHGYEIKRLINEVIQTFTYLDAESIYYPLRVMEQKGYIAKEVSRSGRRPEKYIYHISAKGEQRFDELINKNFLSIKRPFFNIDLSLYFLPYISARLAQRRLSARLNLLKMVKNGLEKVTEKQTKAKAPSHLLSILKHNLDLIRAEIKFTESLITAEFKK